MPEEVIEAPPAESAAPAPVSPSMDNLDMMAAQWNQNESKLEPAQDKEKPITPPPDKKPEKPADKPADKVSTKPPEKPTTKPDASKPAPKLYEAHENLKKSHKELEETHKKIVAEREAYALKIKELESNAIDPKKYESAQQERDRLAAELRESSYERSPECKKEFKIPMQNTYSEAVKAMPSLRIQTTNPETGEVSERPATEQDFRRLYALDAVEQDKALKAFGPSENRVRRYLEKYYDLEEKMNQRIKEEAETGEAKQKEAQEKTVKERNAWQQRYQELKEAGFKQLQEDFPQHFKVPESEGEGADKEIADAMHSALTQFDGAITSREKDTMDTIAANAATIRARFVAYPRMVIEMKRMSEELETLKKRLATKERSDPGSGGERGEGGGAPSGSPLGIDGAAAAWDS